MSSGLIDAIRGSHTDVVAAYLLAGADPNFIEDDDNVTPLHHAVQFSNIDIIEMLIIAGADLFAETTYEELTPLEVACEHENWPVATVLGHYCQYLYVVVQIAWYLL